MKNYTTEQSRTLLEMASTQEHIELILTLARLSNAGKLFLHDTLADLEAKASQSNTQTAALEIWNRLEPQIADINGSLLDRFDAFEDDVPIYQEIKDFQSFLLDQNLPFSFLYELMQKMMVYISKNDNEELTEVMLDCCKSLCQAHNKLEQYAELLKESDNPIQRQLGIDTAYELSISSQNGDIDF